MRTFPLYQIILFCLLLFLIDLAGFYSLKYGLQDLSSGFLKAVIVGCFWTFSLGIILAILSLKLRVPKVPVTKKQLYISRLYGLTITKIVPEVTFIVAIIGLYYLNSMVPEEKPSWMILVGGLLCAAIPLIFLLYAIIKGRYHFKVHEVVVNIKNLPTAFTELQFVQISDLHLGSFNYNYAVFNRAVDLINELKPDFIFFTGDIVNNYAWELKGWEDSFKKLKANRGKYSIMGNHDYGDYSTWESSEAKQKNLDKIKEFHRKAGFKLLLNEAEVVENKGNQFAIVGVENWGGPPFKKYGDLKKALKSVKTLPFKILLSHDPTHWDEEVLKHKSIKLTLSGHTHGMQAGINFKNRKWSPIKYKYKRWAGLYKTDEQFLYVNRGLGWLGFPGRLGMRPEITLIKFKNTD